MSSNYLVKNGLAVIQLSNPPLNSLSVKLRDSILRCIDRATSTDKVAGVVITNSGSYFSQGYDTIETIRGNLQQSPSLNLINSCIESQSIPFVTAFNGIAFGAALELGLSCHYRIATESSQFGFTDSEIGLPPAAGGTIRFPRVVRGPSPLLTSIDYLVSGKKFSSEEAERIGYLDKVFTANNFLEVIDGSIKFLESEIVRSTPLRDRILSAKNISDLRPSVEEMNRLTARINQNYPELQAPHAIVASVMASLKLNSKINNISNSSINITNNSDINSSRDGSSSSDSGSNDNGLSNALLVEERLQSALFKGSQFKALQYFHHSEKKFNPTNQLSSSSSSPSSSPSPISSIDSKSSPIAFRKTLKVSEGNAKVCDAVWLKLSPFVMMQENETAAAKSASAGEWGVLGNRLLDSYIHEAILLLLEGASIADIDGALSSRVGWQLGPFALLDEIWRKSKPNSDSDGQQFVESWLVNTDLASPMYEKSRVFLQHITEQSGNYDNDKVGSLSSLINSQVDRARIALNVKKEEGVITSDEIVDRCMFVLVNACYKIIEDSKNTVTSNMLDVVFVNGYGFPRHKGGVLWWAERECKMTTVAVGLAKYFAASSPPDQRYNRCQLIEDTVSGQAILREEQYFRKK